MTNKISRPSQKIFFVTGTDTDSGKTFASCSMLAAAKTKGYSTAAIKPVAAGVSNSSQGLFNEDVIALGEYCSPALTYSEINPLCFDEAIAPHIAAAKTGVTLQADKIAEQCYPVIKKRADLTLIEGAGGWKVPLSVEESMADIARILEIPVILVVGVRLGCLNHALLTAQAIQADGVRPAGWIANQMDADMVAYQENVSTLAEMMSVPLLAEIPWLNGEDLIKQAQCFIDMDKIMSA